jgi:two-component system CheB/CheR fusion protein
MNSPVHIVGIGASAGGLEAIELFFKNMPPDSGVAFVVIQHLSPHHKSLMAELLSKHTAMPVHRAEDGMLVEANKVYLIPPDKNLRVFHGKLLLSGQKREEGGINLPIDIFFKSLADDFADKAIAIVLSGTGSDGSSGIRSIKENLGMVMVQSEESAGFDGMPRSAIATGVVDYILPPDEMPSQLLSYLKHPFASNDEPGAAIVTNEGGLSRIFALLRESTKIDFTHYKLGTISRRIERRMAVNQIEDLQEYVNYLEVSPSELDSLHRDLLIGVTSFFRDPESFESLDKSHLPPLFSNSSEQLRIWVAGCSTGEEAYSLAILSREIVDRYNLNVDVKIFATDVDRNAILEASAGVFAESSIANIKPELISRHFFPKQDGYQISRQIREMIVFAQHNLIKDPPFTNIDLISCRNLLIYLQPVLQKKALELFNFALNPGGIMFLGSSETTGDMSEFFEPLDAKWRIYQSKGRRRATDLSQVALDYRGYNRRETSVRSRSSGSQLHVEERLLERFLDVAAQDFLPFSFIITEKMELMHVIGDSSPYLKFQSGKVVNDVTKLVNRDLAIPLSTGLQKVLNKNEELVYTNIYLRGVKPSQIVNMRMKPLTAKKGQTPLIAVFIEPVLDEQNRDDSVSSQSYNVGEEAQQRISDLENELQFTRENLQATVEELETSNEELQATNEELLASNEELQSTNEELQSVNEELYTVNSEYQGKITELTEANNDLDNLLKNTRVATIFLDEDLDIRRFTPETAQLLRIMDQDVGRPLSFVAHDFKGIDLIELVKSVRQSEEVLQLDVKTEDGRSIILRIDPYQVAHKVFTGMVLTFIDVSHLRQTQEELNQRSQLLATLIGAIPDGFILIDKAGKIKDVNPAVTNLLGYSTEELLGKNVSVLMPEDIAVHHDGYLRDYIKSGEANILGRARLVNAQHLKGHIVPLELTVSEVDTDNQQWFAGLLRTPITEP